MSYWFVDGGGNWRKLLPLLGKDDVIIGSNDNINNFFDEFSDASVIRLETPTSLYGGSVVKNIINAKREYKKYFKDIENEKICLFGGLKTITFFSYMKKLSKSNMIFFVVPDRPDFSFFRQTDSWFLKSIPMKLIGYSLGIDIGITKLLDKPMWYLKEKTIPKYGLMKYSDKEPVVEMPDKYKKLLSGKDTLLLLNDLGTLVHSPHIVSKMISESVDFDKTIVKNHTRDPEIFGKLNEFDRFPSFVPAEILINNHEWKYIISVYISKSMMTDIDTKKLSLYKIFDWKIPVSVQWIGKCDEYNVKLPKNIEELEVMLHEE